MNDENTSRIRCATVPYRSGFIEIANVHSGCVNLETWDADLAKAPAGADVRDIAFPEEAVRANVELELTISEARTLVTLLEHAIAAAEVNGGA